MWTAKSVRDSFIAFFKSKQHEVVAASPVVPDGDPTLLFINAGMNQFKDVFLGQGTRPYSRAVDAQPCIRVSGKHNDLEDVGRDTTHLTLFEMLGNWSFGDYYKQEAIIWAWEYLTSVLPLPKDKLYATVYKTDDESESLWKESTDINPNHVLRFGDKDNFWEMGETGPCGPCSEIHIDLGPKACDKQGMAHDCFVNGDCNRYVELWNLVFIQFERQPDRSLKELPAKHVDTGMGFERLVSVLQGNYSAYQTDMFQPIIRSIEMLSGHNYQDNLEGMPFRVMADHVRMLSLSIADNVMPSNEGRGYVLRRLLRRALRYSKLLGFSEPVLFKLVPNVVETLGQAYPQIQARADFITNVIQAEEESFLKTLAIGLERFEDIASQLSQSGKTLISGDDVFKLYDTFGFPADLTDVLAKERGFDIDKSGFESALNTQKAQSRKATKAALAEQSDVDESPKWTLEETQSFFKSLPLHLSSYVDRARGGEARLVYSAEEKLGMARHHTATHLLHEALRQVLGDHVEQAGSLVDVDRLRFDFTHFQGLTASELSRVEAIVNEKIDLSISVDTFHNTLEEAKAKGARALFGEKYDEADVRVVQIGTFSTELCGGTHVQNTGLIESFKLISESAVGAGIRRIEAICGTRLIQSLIEKEREHELGLYQSKLNYVHQLEKQILVHDPDFKLNLPIVDTHTISSIVSGIEALQMLSKSLEKTLQKFTAKEASGTAQALLENVKQLGKLNLKYVTFYAENLDTEALRKISDQATAAEPYLISLVGTEKSGKATVIVKLGKSVDLSQITAPKIIDVLKSEMGGGGGGRPDMAQAGGGDFSKIESAFAKVEAWLNER